MSSFFESLIEQGFALVYIYDISILPNSKEHMFRLMFHLNNYISTKHYLKLAQQISFFMLLKVEFLGHEFAHNTIKPLHSKVAAIHKLNSPTGNVALKYFIDALSFYKQLLKNFRLTSNRSKTYYTEILLGLGLQKMNITPQVKKRTH